MLILNLAGEGKIFISEDKTKSRNIETNMPQIKREKYKNLSKMGKRKTFKNNMRQNEEIS